MEQENTFEFGDLPAKPCRIKRAKPFDAGRSDGEAMKKARQYTPAEIQRVCDREEKGADAYTRGLIAGLRGA